MNIGCVHSVCASGAAENPQPDDLIQSAIYFRDGAAEAVAERNNRTGRGRSEHALSEGQGHQGMDIDSAAAHRIPRGELATFQCRNMFLTLLYLS